MSEAINKIIDDSENYQVKINGSSMVLQLLTKSYEPHLKKGWKLHYIIELIAVQTY